MKLIKNKKKVEIYKKILKMFIIAILIEIFICNFSAFRTILLGNNNKKVNYTYEDNKIKIYNIDVRATSLYIVYKSYMPSITSYSLRYVSEENDIDMYLDSKTIKKDNYHFINFDTHSKCEEIEIDINSEYISDIKEILINHPNFNINLFRILILFGIIFLISKLKDKNIYNKIYNPNSLKQKYQSIIILSISCIILCMYTINQQSNSKDGIYKRKVTPDDTILMQAEALAQGQISFLIEPDEKLVDMKDPYNYGEKVKNGIPFYFDTTYYDGNYYSYFGIAPIITLVLPFRLLTGMYLETYIFNMIYFIGVVFLLYDVYKNIIKKYIKKVSLCNFYLGYFAILFGSNALITLRGEKYDIVTTSGIMFILLSLDLAIKIGISEKYRKLKFIGLGISMGLIVLSKPTYIVYYPLILFLLWNSIKIWENKDKIKDSIYGIVPLGIFAIFQMIYNYVRFDNILEFGAKYQLTASNMKYCMMFTIGKAFSGILEYGFKLPQINLLKFPFVFMMQNETDMFMNEFCYEAHIMGLIAIPILWIYIFKKNILKKENRELNILINITIITTLIDIIIVTVAGGICEAYIVDLKVILCIFSVILLLKNIEIRENKEDVNKIFLILCICTILLMIPSSMSGGNGWLGDLSSPTTIYLKNMFEFWT